jgi:mannose-6-phosphate isomerase-like protein (cupin superfamily)
MTVDVRELRTGVRLADDDTVRMEAVELAPGKAWPLRRHPASDAVLLFYEGAGEVRTADRVHAFRSLRHAFVPAGTTYEVRSTGDRPLKAILGLCPFGPTEVVARPDRRAGPGGVTMLSIEQYDRFPDSGLVRGGMFFLEPGKDAAYHSHDGAPEVFVFLRGTCDITVEGQSARAGAGQVVYVPMELKHRLVNPSATEKLYVWLTVTPNVTPSHTYYEPQADGTWKRITPRLDGRPSRPPGP